MLPPSVVHTNVVCIFLLLFFLCIILLRKLFDSMNKIPSKAIKLSITIYLSSLAVNSLLMAIHGLIEYLRFKSDSNDLILESMKSVAFIIRVISGGGTTVASIAYFVKIKLEDIYKETFLQINQLFINTIFVIYVISVIIWISFLAIFNGLNYWYSSFSNNIYQQLLQYGLIQLISVGMIYFITILILFNVKLYKFISLTIQNNQQLSLEINNRIKYVIIKQTNLISIIAIALCIFQIVMFLRWIWFPENNNFTMLYHWVWFLDQSITAICIYFTFKFNNNYYISWCKYCDYCCNYIHTKLNNINMIDDDHYILLSDININSINSINSDNQHVNCILYDESACNVLNCLSFCRLIALLTKYNASNEDEFEYIKSDNYELCDIINDFNHLLSKHDSEYEFNIIYNRLNENCDYKQCKIYSRHYFRRRNQRDLKQRFKNNDEKLLVSKNIILDKMHAFYYHSYDTFLRMKFEISQRNSTSAENEDEGISEIYKIIKSQTHNIDYDIICNNKFNSDLHIDDDDNVKGNIYSFGQRFEYEQADSEWFVNFTCKNLKHELINNKSCNIAMGMYQNEYKKCIAYFKSEHVKRLKNRNLFRTLSMENIFVLLIYCNCDNYQKKWSSTYRRIPNNESNESLKKRHSNFCYSSKYIRDLIEYFGERLMDIDNNNKTFYHGVNQILYLTRTITKFNGPLSTSTEINVALNFSHNTGIVLQLKYALSTYLLHATYFNCAFFSDYVNEKECLFIGGIPRMIITNIINVTNGEIYKKYINALNIINCLLDGTIASNTNTKNNNNYQCNQHSIDLCCDLLCYQLNSHSNEDDAKCEYSDYVTTLLNEYCMNLKHIMIFWHHVEGNIILNLKHLLCNNKNLELFFDFKILLKLFPNLEQIEYCNKSSNSIKNTIKTLINYVIGYNIKNNLKYIIIHHSISSVLMSKFKKIVQDNNYWNLYRDSKKLILYKCNFEINFNLLTIRFNQINQASASKNMIRKLL